MPGSVGAAAGGFFRAVATQSVHSSHFIDVPSATQAFIWNQKPRTWVENESVTIG
jgi:hypothetical protein